MQIINCNTVDELFSYLQFTNFIWKGAGLGQIAFRGQGDASWELVPKAFRKGELLGYSPEPSKAPLSDIKRQAKGEYESVLSFIDVADRVGLELPGDVYSFRTLTYLNGDEASEFWTKKWPHPSQLELLAIAQHHGVPTRLLDFTFNPLVALYFAARSALDIQSEGINDGRFAIWGVDLRFLREMSNRRTNGREPIVEVVVPRFRNPYLRAQQALSLLDGIVNEHWNNGDCPPINRIVADRVEYWLGRKGIWEKLGQPESQFALPLVKIEASYGIAMQSIQNLHLQGINPAAITPSHDHVVDAIQFMVKHNLSVI